MPTFAALTGPRSRLCLAVPALGAAASAPPRLRSRGEAHRVADRRVRVAFAATLVAALTVATAVVPVGRSAVSQVPSAVAGVPAGLVHTIHRLLGPGPVGLGTAPTAPTITAAASGWAAQVPSASIRAELTRSGTTRVWGAGRSQASLMPISLAAGSARRALGPPSSSLQGGTLTQRYGIMSSSYQTTRTGLEQRFEIPRSLDPRAPSLTVSFGSRTRWSVDGGGTALSTQGADSRLVYGDLLTTDRSGRRLPSHFVSGPGGPAIVVATTGARFPITVDPTWVTVSIPPRQPHDEHRSPR